MQVTAIVLAAGRGERLGLGFNKVFAELSGRPVVVRSLEIFENIPEVAQTIVVSAAGEEEQIRALVEKYAIKKVKTIVAGGSTRSRSVAAALPYISCCSDWILIHDGARPLLQVADIQSLLQAAEPGCGAILAVPVVDTVKEVHNGVISNTPERALLWAAQTPQMFPVAEYLDACALLDNSLTDDASLFEAAGRPVKIVPGSADNIKITRLLDLELAELLLKKRQEAGKCE